jgi:hypothetical protein
VQPRLFGSKREVGPLECDLFSPASLGSWNGIQEVEGSIPFGFCHFIRCRELLVTFAAEFLDVRVELSRNVILTCLTSPITDLLVAAPLLAKLSMR